MKEIVGEMAKRAKRKRFTLEHNPKEAEHDRIRRAQLIEKLREHLAHLKHTSDDTLSAKDVTLGYKQLVDVEDAFRTMKRPRWN